MGGYINFLSKEDLLQKACVEYMLYQYRNKLFFHVPNEGKRTKYERFYIKVMHVLPGVSDLVFLEPEKGYNGLMIELKVKPNKPTKHQLEFLKMAHERNYYTRVIYSFDDFKKCVDWYFG